jgi:hypothetical protein
MPPNPGITEFLSLPYLIALLVQVVVVATNDVENIVPLL